jgi:hypothetical protein
MDGFQLTIIAKAVNEWQWQDDPARHERRGPAGANLGAWVGSQHIWSAADKIVSIFVLAFAVLVGGALLTSGAQDVSSVAAAAPEQQRASVAPPTGGS